MRQPTRAEIHTQRRSDRRTEKKQYWKKFGRDTWDIISVVAVLALAIIVIATLGGR